MYNIYIYIPAYIHIQIYKADNDSDISITRSGDIFQWNPKSHANALYPANMEASSIPNASKKNIGSAFHPHRDVTTALPLNSHVPHALASVGHVHELAPHHATPTLDYQILPVQVESRFGGVRGGDGAGGGGTAGGGGGEKGRGGSAPGPSKAWSDIENIGQGLLESVGLGWRAGEGANECGSTRRDMTDTHPPPPAGSFWRDTGAEAGRGNVGRGGGGGERDGDTLYRHTHIVCVYIDVHILYVYIVYT